MNRTYMLTAAALAALAVALAAGASVAPGAKPAEEKKPDATAGHKTAVFNMAAVMRDFHQAKYQVWLLNKKREKLSRDIVGWRNEYIQLQREAQAANKPPAVDGPDAASKKLLELARKIEDADRRINKEINDDASTIIAELYDKVKVVVDRAAEQEGFKLVLAYPNAVTPEEANSPYIKELKLKPPAAQPFYVSPDIDITARVVKELNEKYPAVDAETKKPVDVSKLEAVPAAGPVPAAPMR